jgi:hypothetical protein
MGLQPDPPGLITCSVGNLRSSALTMGGTSLLERPLSFLAMALVAATAIGLGACGGPTVTISHQDPAHSLVDVFIDDARVGQVSYGEELSLTLDPGTHTVQTVPEGADKNPWTDDGEGWHFVLDEEATLTLLPSLPPSGP